MTGMSASEFRQMRAEVITATNAALLDFIRGLGIVSTAVVAEILDVDAAQAAAHHPCASTPAAGLLTVEQVAEQLAVSVDDIRWMYLQDGLHYIHIGYPGDDGGLVRFARDDVAAYVRSRRVRTS